MKPKLPLIALSILTSTILLADDEIRGPLLNGGIGNINHILCQQDASLFKQRADLTPDNRFLSLKQNNLFINDLLYAPSFLYDINGDTHCAINTNSRIWFGEKKSQTLDQAILQTSRRKHDTTTKFTLENGVGKGLVGADNNYQSQMIIGSEWEKYFDKKIVSKYTSDIYKSFYVDLGNEGLPIRLTENNPNIKPLVSVTKAEPTQAIALGKNGGIYNFNQREYEYLKFETVKPFVELKQDGGGYQLNENVHRFSIPSGTTGVLNTWVTIERCSGGQCEYNNPKDANLSYFLTQDIGVGTITHQVLENPRGNNSTFYYRKRDAGEGIFEAKKGMAFNVGSLGLLSPVLFESSVFKYEDLTYRYDIYTLHGDFMNRFITGFGPIPQKNWKTECAGGCTQQYGWAKDYDGGWMSHRYIYSKPKSSVYSDFGLGYDPYDPITTFIADDKNSYGFNASKIFKQYAIDNAEDTQDSSAFASTKRDYSIHVRPVFAQIKKNGETYAVDDTILKRFAGVQTYYVLQAAYYPDPQDILSIKPFDAGVTMTDLAYNSALQLNDDYSEFEMDTWGGALGDKGWQSNSINSKDFIVRDKNGNDKKLTCRWVQNGWASVSGALPPVLSCYTCPTNNGDTKCGVDLSDTAESRATKYDKDHTIKIKADDIANGYVDIFKFVLNDKTPIPVRKDKNENNANLKVGITLERIYAGNDVRQGNAHNKNFDNGAFVYDFTKGGKMEYYTGFQWYGNNSEADQYRGMWGGDEPTYFRYDVGLKGKIDDSVKNNAKSDLAQINLNANVRMVVHKNSSEYIVSVNLTDEAKEAMNRLPENQQRQYTFFLRVNNIYDGERIIPFNKGFRLILEGTPPPPIPMRVASDIGLNKPAKNKNGDLLLYDQVAGLFIDELKENPSVPEITSYEKNSNHLGGHFVLDQTKAKGDEFVNIILQKELSPGNWVDLGQVILKNSCTYKYNKNEQPWCQIKKWRGGENWETCAEGDTKCRSLQDTFDNNTSYTELAHTLLINYNYLNSGEIYPFTLQEIFQGIPKDSQKAQHNEKKKFGISYAWEGNDGGKHAKELASTPGVFRFKVSVVTKEMLVGFFKKNHLRYHDGVIYHDESTEYSKSNLEIKLENMDCSGSDIVVCHTEFWKKAIYNYINFANDDDKKGENRHSYSSAFVVRPAYAKISKMYDKDNTNETSLATTIKAQLPANEDNQKRFEFDFYAAKYPQVSSYTSLDTKQPEAQTDAKIPPYLLKFIRINAVKLGLLYDMSSTGLARHYFLNQRDDKDNIINEGSQAIVKYEHDSSKKEDVTDDKIMLNAKINSPYAGDVGLFSLIQFGKINEDLCDKDRALDKQNKAIDGKYGCYPETLNMPYFNFTGHSNVLCDLENQFAFFRERENTNDAENKKKFDKSGLFNITYQCVKKYVDNNGTPIYSIGTLGCNSDLKSNGEIDTEQQPNAHLCNQELATISKADINFDISGGLSGQTYGQTPIGQEYAENNGLNIFLYDANYLADPNEPNDGCDKWLNNPELKEWADDGGVEGGSIGGYNRCKSNESKIEEWSQNNVYQNYFTLSNNANFKAASLNSRIFTAIMQNMGGVEMENTHLSDYLKSKFLQQNNGSIYELDFDKNKNYNQPINNKFDITNVGNIFKISISQDREKGKKEPIVIKEKVTTDRGACFNDCSDDIEDQKIRGYKESVLKYGVLESKDIILKNPIKSTNDVINTDKDNSNDPRFAIKVYENGRFRSLISDDTNARDYDFTKAVKNIGFDKLNEQILGQTGVTDKNSLRFNNETSGYAANVSCAEYKTAYCIDNTRIVDVAFNHSLGENPSYKVKAKDSKAVDTSFEDIGTITIKKDANIKKILTPISDTIKIIYEEVDDGAWRGIKNYSNE